jgi:sugar lactone lactonase YvrE
VSARTNPVIGSGEHTYEVIHDWGGFPAHISYGNTHGVAQDAQGRVYIAHTVHAGSESQDTLLVFDEKGKFIRSWGAEFKGGAHGLHVRREGRDEYLYFVDTGKGRRAGIDPTKTCMVKMTLRGEEVLRIGYPRESPHYNLDKDGNPATKFSPTNVAIAPNGDIYVADGYGSYYINQYDAKGHFIRTFGGSGKEPGQLACPHGLIADTRGSTPVLLVADRTNNRLQRFSLDGKHLGFIGGVNLPCHFAERDGILLVPDLAARITLLDRQNRVILHLGEDASGNWQDVRKQSREHFTPGKFVSPHGACFDHDGNIFVVEWVEIGRITKLRKVA